MSTDRILHTLLEERVCVLRYLKPRCQLMAWHRTREEGRSLKQSRMRRSLHAHNNEKPMKTILKASSIALVALTWPLSAQVTEKKETTETKQHADGSTTETTTETTRTFNPEVQTKVVKYFEPYKTERYGLPPGVTVSVKEIPADWRTTNIRPGLVVAEKQRSYLVAAPPELVKILPAPRAETRYYIAGSNVVAVDKSYKIVDSIHIPSINLTVEKE